MRLAVITNDGEVIEVMDDLEEYDLSKSFARADVADAIQRAMAQHEADKEEDAKQEQPL